MKTFITRILAVIEILALAVTLPVSTLAEAGRAADAPVRGEIWDGSIAGGFAGGTGAEADPYLISNGAQLAYLAQQVNSETSYEGSYFELTEDIYLNDTTGWENWGDYVTPANEWTPIGTGYNYPFSGSFDGNEHAVHGVYINEPEADDQGLFGYAVDSTIANLDVSESCIHGDYYVGGVAGCNLGTIINCRNTGSVTGSENVGGVVGDNSGTVSNCYNTGSVSIGCDDSSAGGVVGDNSGTVTNCCNTGCVTGRCSAGGVVGDNSGTVTNCCNTGCVTGGIWGTGGAVGDMYGGNVANCYNTGSVAGEQWTGGVIGFIVGGDVSCCYNTGSVTGDRSVWGVVGVNGDGTVIDCYYLDTCCSSGDEYGAALTDAQMREAGSFVGFDFAEVWTMEGNASYPYPELISNPHGGVSESVPGDLNNDGVTTSEDALLVLRMALGLDTSDPNGDVNGDGAVTPDDALVILRWALGL